MTVIVVISRALVMFHKYWVISSKWVPIMILFKFVRISSYEKTQDYIIKGGGVGEMLSNKTTTVTTK